MADFTVRIEMPSGYVSKGYDKVQLPALATEEGARKCMESVLRQLKEQNVTGAKVLLYTDETKVDESEVVA